LLFCCIVREASNQYLQGFGAVSSFLRFAEILGTLTFGLKFAEYQDKAMCSF